MGPGHWREPYSAARSAHDGEDESASASCSDSGVDRPADSGGTAQLDVTGNGRFLADGRRAVELSVVAGGEGVALSVSSWTYRAWSMISASLSG